MNYHTEEQKLHDRATRGQKLSEAEQSALDAWYSRLDAEEAEMFRRAQYDPLEDRLRAQLDGLLSELARVTQQVQQTSSDNEALRQEIQVLRESTYSERKLTHAA